jgi:hypothetical protein
MWRGNVTGGTVQMKILMLSPAKCVVKDIIIYIPVFQNCVSEEKLLILCNRIQSGTSRKQPANFALCAVPNSMWS